MRIEDVLVIVPAYNEEKSLPNLLRELAGVCPLRNTLVVNDGSSDGTSSVARSAGVAVVDLPLNSGIGVTMQTGYKYARRHGFRFAAQCDADGQHVPAHLALLLKKMEETGAAMVVGSRFVGESAGFKSYFVRRQFIVYFSWLIRLLCGVRIRDVTSGFRLCDERGVELFSEVYPFDYPEPEAIILLSRAGLGVAECPVQMRERQGGVSSIGFFAGAYYVVKVSLGLLVRRLRNGK